MAALELYFPGPSIFQFKGDLEGVDSVATWRVNKHAGTDFSTLELVIKPDVYGSDYSMDVFKQLEVQVAKALGLK